MLEEFVGLLIPPADLLARLGGVFEAAAGTSLYSCETAIATVDSRGNESV